MSPDLRRWLRYAVVAGDAVFVAWVTYNAVNEGFAGTLPQKASYDGLTVLLLLNAVLILRSPK